MSESLFLFFSFVRTEIKSIRSLSTLIKFYEFLVFCRNLQKTASTFISIIPIDDGLDAINCSVQNVYVSPMASQSSPLLEITKILEAYGNKQSLGLSIDLNTFYLFIYFYF